MFFFLNKSLQKFKFRAKGNFMIKICQVKKIKNIDLEDSLFFTEVHEHCYSRLLSLQSDLWIFHSIKRMFHILIFRYHQTVLRENHTNLYSSKQNIRAVFPQTPGLPLIFASLTLDSSLFKAEMTYLHNINARLTCHPLDKTGGG